MSLLLLLFLLLLHGAASFRCVRRLNPDFFLGARGSRLYAKQTDKWEVLNTFGKRPGELDADGIVTAWVTLSRRSTPAGPRNSHLPPFHTDYRFLALLGRTATICPCLRPTQLAALLSSLAKLRFRPDDSLLHGLVESCLQSEELEFGASARILTALTQLDYQLVDLAVQTRLIEGLGSLPAWGGDAEGVSSALWWMVVSGAYKVHPELVESLVQRAYAELRVWEYEGHPSASTGKRRLRVCRQLGWVLKYPLNAGPVEDLQALVTQALTGLSEWQDPAKSSRLQAEVLQAAIKHGAECEAEWSDGVMSIDLVLHPRRGKGLPVAVEVDGPSHFFINHQSRPTGQTLSKMRTLREAYRESWAAVLNVPHFGWPRKNQQGWQGRFLWNRLKERGLDPTVYMDQPPGHKK